jgi:two-component system chemotaxis response regulator CheB
MRMNKIKVLIVDDSVVVRNVLQSVLASDPSIQVIGAVLDPIYAMKHMEREWPDVIVLDIEMPRMDGITFLKQIMKEHPTPVVICSSFTERVTAATIQAMEAGAVTVIAKPKTGLMKFLTDAAPDLIMAVKEAAHAKIGRLKHLPVMVPKEKPKLTADAMLHMVRARAMGGDTERIIGMGTSTGGTQALEAVLTALPSACPGIVIVQHMPEQFTAAFAERINTLSEIEVREAQNDDRVIPGLALIAPGGKQMELKRRGAHYHVEIKDGPRVNGHRPSVNVLFSSMAKAAGKNATGIIMTGMGDDGASGLKEMHDAGAYTVAQDEETCLIFGMPREAIKLGGVYKVMALSDIHKAILAG